MLKLKSMRALYKTQEQGSYENNTYCQMIIPSTFSDGL